MELMQSFRCGSELTYTLFLARKHTGSLFSVVCCYRAYWNPITRGNKSGQLKVWVRETEEHNVRLPKLRSQTAQGKNLHTIKYFVAPTTPSTPERRAGKLDPLRLGQIEKHWPFRSMRLKVLRPATENSSSSVNKLVPLCPCSLLLSIVSFGLDLHTSSSFLQSYLRHQDPLLGLLNDCALTKIHGLQVLQVSKGHVGFNFLRNCSFSPHDYFSRVKR